MKGKEERRLCGVVDPPTGVYCRAPSGLTPQELAEAAEAHHRTIRRLGWLSITCLHEFMVLGCSGSSLGAEASPRLEAGALSTT